MIAWLVALSCSVIGRVPVAFNVKWLEFMEVAKTVANSSPVERLFSINSSAI